MNIILFDYPEIKKSLLPFTFTRPVAKIRIGIFTINEKWENYLESKTSFLCEHYLSSKFILKRTNDNLLINGAVCPNQELISQINDLPSGVLLTFNNIPVAIKIGDFGGYDDFGQIMINSPKTEYKGRLTIIKNNWDIFSLNGEEIRNDFNYRLQKQHTSNVSDPHTIIYNRDNIIIEGGAKIKAATLNAEQGPIYIGKNAEVQEGALIRGPFALCEGSVVNMGAKIRGDTTIGPYSKVGGEISNSVIFGYSNKGHDGFLGSSVIGEWCNLGADTNTSNLKNNYSNVKLWSYNVNDYVDTNRQFCGLMMGDHSKAGINTMFNTGTVVGINSNLFGGGFPPKFIPSYAWGGSEGFQKYDFDKAMQVATVVMERRNIEFSNEDYELLKHVYLNY